MNAKQWYQRSTWGKQTSSTIRESLKMATSISTISRRISRSVLSKTTTTQLMPFSTTSHPEFHDSAPEFDSSYSQSPPSSPPGPRYLSRQAPWRDEVFENGVQTGIFRAILVGQVGQRPMQKMRSQRRFIIFPVGTGGIHNYGNRGEHANEYNVQWHRVCLYQEDMVDTAMKHLIPGSTVYLEGNLETRVYTDQMTGLTRQLREVAIRREGRIIFLGKGDENSKTTMPNLRNVGYF